MLVSRGDNDENNETMKTISLSHPKHGSKHILQFNYFNQITYTLLLGDLFRYLRFPDNGNKSDKLTFVFSSIFCYE